MKLPTRKYNLFILMISLSCLLILTLGIFIVEKRNKRLAKRALHKNVFHLKDHKLIEWIHVKPASISCKKINQSWKLSKKDKPYPPDNQTIGFFALRLSKLSYKESFPEVKPSQLSSIFGINLKNPWIEFKAKNKTFKLFKGNKTPSQDAYYLATNTSKLVFVVSKTAIRDLKFSLTDLRDKDFFKLHIDDIQSIMLHPIKKNPSYIKRQAGIAEILYKVPKTSKESQEFKTFVQYEDEIHQIKLKNLALMTNKNYLKSSLISLSSNSFYIKTIKSLFSNMHGSHWIIESSRQKPIRSEDLDSWILDITYIEAKDFVDSPQAKTLPQAQLVLMMQKKDKNRIHAQFFEMNHAHYVQIKNDPTLYRINSVFYKKIMKNLLEFYT